ncbi:MAG: DUF4160 domain-containing protein [Clostridiales bacterium]|jgi:hypothetical protein|nr:DUF4160 domain-containing protein [Clostridiales bacterium]
MPTLSLFRGIKVYINFSDHAPPHFHASYGGEECSILIEELELLAGSMPKKQLKMVLGWAAFNQEKLRENWELASNNHQTFPIEPLR